jgi:hypothetical protein
MVEISRVIAITMALAALQPDLTAAMLMFLVLSRKEVVLPIRLLPRMVEGYNHWTENHGKSVTIQAAARQQPVSKTRFQGGEATGGHTSDNISTGQIRFAVAGGAAPAIAW